MYRPGGPRRARPPHSFSARRLQTMAQRQTLPVLPLRGTVIFPGLTAPIAAGRPGTLRAIEAALKGDRLVFAVAQRDNTDEPTPEILYSMGVIARIGQIQRGLGGVQLLLQGEQRATALQYTTSEGYLAAVIIPTEEMSPVNEHDPAFEALHKEIRERAVELGERRGLPEEVVHQVLDSVTDPGRFADLVAGYIELSVAEKQGLLETLECRGAAPSGTRACPAPDRTPRGPGGDQVAGPGRAGRAAARDVLARAAEGDSERAGRRRPGARSDRASREAGQARATQGSAGRGGARARSARARRTRIDGSPGDPHVSRVDRGAALEHPLR